MVGSPSNGGAQTSCADNNAGLSLPPGFCATIYADQTGNPRHITVAENGDLFAGRLHNGGILALHDSDGDGVADIREVFGFGSVNDVVFHNGYLYFATQGEIMRYLWTPGSLRPDREVDTIVSGLPARRSHAHKSLTFGADGMLYVNIGSPSNVCVAGRGRGPRPGQDPCPELDRRAGIWRFDPDQPNQHQSDGERFATGIRNAVALTTHPVTGQIYAVFHGRDRLGSWPGYSTRDNAEKPAEEFILIEEGDDFGWPYCYFDREIDRLVLAPEYGGDGQRQGRCAEKKDPLMGFPAHWAPDALLFYTGTQFPDRYNEGAFVAFHGSWNRAPLPQAGYNITFAPFESGTPTGSWEIFADGFSTDPPNLSGPHRPMGLAQGVDGSLFVSDDTGGRIYRIVYDGDRPLR